MNEEQLNQNINESFVSYGKVLTCKDGIIEIAGLRDVMAGEVVKLGSEQMGMISNLEKNSVSAIVLGNLVTSTGSFLYVPIMSRNLSTHKTYLNSQHNAHINFINVRKIHMSNKLYPFDSIGQIGNANITPPPSTSNIGSIVMGVVGGISGAMVGTVTYDSWSSYNNRGAIWDTTFAKYNAQRLESVLKIGAKATCIIGGAVVGVGAGIASWQSTTQFTHATRGSWK